MDDFYIVGSSPEILVRREGETVTVRPIAGTRKRGNNALEDAELALDLQQDAKEVAEHVMLIDLAATMSVASAKQAKCVSAIK